MFYRLPLYCFMDYMKPLTFCSFIVQYVYINILFLLLPVWADDTWLKEHAGATLDKDEEEAEGENETGEKRPAEDTETVS